MKNRENKKMARSVPDENPAWLLDDPTTPEVPPPVVTRSQQQLPFLALSWENFERICRRLAAASSEIEQAWAYGKRGQAQFGIDILARSRDGAYVVWQTKRYKDAREKDIKAAGELFLKHKWAKQARHFYLVFACPLESTTVIDAIEHIRTQLKAKNIDFIAIDAENLTERLALHPEIIDIFFGREWVKAICPPEAIQRLESKFPTSGVAASPSTYTIAGDEAHRNLRAALEKHNKKLDTISELQTNQATKEDLAAFTKAIEKAAEPVAEKLPRNIADRILREEYLKVLRRRGFVAANSQKEATLLADRAIEGDLSRASPQLISEVCERAARENALPATADLAKQFRRHAASSDPARDLFIVDAYIAAATEDIDVALRELRQREGIEVRSAIFSIVLREKGEEAALEWARAESLRPSDFTAPASMNFLVKTIQNGEFDTALAYINEIPTAYFDELASMYLIRAQLRVASILPPDQKGSIFEGLPADPKRLELASGPNGTDVAYAALRDLHQLAQKLDELDLNSLRDFISEFILWLRLEISDEHAEAFAQLTAEISNPETTLRRVRLALSYNVAFDRDALGRSLAARKKLGGWNTDERFAAFLVAFHSGDPATIAGFVAEHHEDLFSQSDLSHTYLATVEIEALARSGRLNDARAELAAHRAVHLTEAQSNGLMEAIDAIEKGDEAEQHRQRYEQTGSLAELRLLVATLQKNRSFKLLADYLPDLARVTHRLEDFDLALKLLYEWKRDDELLKLASDLPDLKALDLEYESICGWALSRLGRLTEAREVALRLLGLRRNTNDRELAVNTAIETGNWGDLQKIIADEVGRVDELSAEEVMRLARLAHECGSSYVDELREAALSKAPENPHVYLMAFILAQERGEEYRQEQAQGWLGKAIALSGPQGPVQKFSFRDTVEIISHRGNASNKFDQALRRAEMPMFVAGGAQNRRLLDMILGQAFRNADARDGRLSYPIFAFSGAHVPEALATDVTAAFDITALVTLHYLGLLERAFNVFDKVLLSPRTISFLFGERQFLRVQQPSEVAKARRIQALIAAGRLKVLESTKGTEATTETEIDPLLASLLATAQANGGIVVRSAPIPRLNSYLEDAADVSAYSGSLTDTHAALSFLLVEGKIDTSQRRLAEQYLRQIDQGWDSPPIIQGTSDLYLDDLTVTYLDHVNLLDTLTRCVRNVYVPSNVEEYAREVIRHAEHQSDLVENIEQLRAAISNGLTSGRVQFCRRNILDEDVASRTEDPARASPTLDLLYDLTSVDIVIVDDRNLNMRPHWEDSTHRKARVASSLDVLETLKASQAIGDEDYYAARHRLRQAGFYAVSLKIEELLHYLLNASARTDEIVEAPELAAIRESIALPLIHDCFSPAEAPWFGRVRYAFLQATRQIWHDVANQLHARRCSSWLYNNLPNPMHWCATPENEQAWSEARQQLVMQIALLMVLPDTSQNTRKEYFEWLQEKILAPLQRKHPGIFDDAVVALKNYLENLWEARDEVN